MCNRLRSLYRNASQTTRIESFLFLLVVCVFFLVTYHIGSLDAQALPSAPQKSFFYPVVHSDSEGYALLGKNLLTQGVYSTSAVPPYEPEINWAPGYPLLIACSLFIFGSTVPLVIFQIFLAGVVAILMFRITARFVPPYIAILPALAFTFDLSIAYYTSTVHTDGLFMALITILIYALFFTHHRKHSITLLFTLGLLLGFASLVRTIGQYLIVVIPLLYCIYAVIEYKEKKQTLILKMLAFIFGVVVVITPWMVRNHDVIGSYTLGNIGPKMFLHYYVKDFLTVRSLSERHGDFAQSDSAAEITHTLDSELADLVRTQGGTKESHYQELAIHHIMENPLAYGKFHFIGTLPYFVAGSYRHFFVSILGQYQERAGLPHPTHENIAHKMTEVLYGGTLHEVWGAVTDLSFVLFEIVWRIALILLGLIAFCVPQRKNKILVLILWIFICYFAFLTGPAALTRYRIVSEPILLSLAGIGGWIAYEYLRNLYCTIKLKQFSTSI